MTPAYSTHDIQPSSPAITCDSEKSTPPCVAATLSELYLFSFSLIFLLLFCPSSLAISSHFPFPPQYITMSLSLSISLSPISSLSLHSSLSTIHSLLFKSPTSHLPSLSPASLYSPLPFPFSLSDLRFHFHLHLSSQHNY